MEFCFALGTAGGGAIVGARFRDRTLLVLAPALDSAEWSGRGYKGNSWEIPTFSTRIGFKAKLRAHL